MSAGGPTLSKRPDKRLPRHRGGAAVGLIATRAKRQPGAPLCNRKLTAGSMLSRSPRRTTNGRPPTSATARLFGGLGRRLTPDLIIRIAVSISATWAGNQSASAPTARDREMTSDLRWRSNPYWSGSRPIRARDVRNRAAQPPRRRRAPNGPRDAPTRDGRSANGKPQLTDR